MDDKARAPEILKNRSYLLVWAALIALTLLATAVPEAGLSGAMPVAVPLIIATVKASLVLMFFMHLYHDRGFYRVIGAVSVITAGVFFVLLYFDVAYRG